MVNVARKIPYMDLTGYRMCSPENSKKLRQPIMTIWEWYVREMRRPRFRSQWLSRSECLNVFFAFLFRTKTADDTSLLGYMFTFLFWGGVWRLCLAWIGLFLLFLNWVSLTIFRHRFQVSQPTKFVTLVVVYCSNYASSAAKLGLFEPPFLKQPSLHLKDGWFRMVSWQVLC